MDAVAWFANVGIADRPTVGGKGGSLGELTQAGIDVPSASAPSTIPPTAPAGMATIELTDSTVVRSGPSTSRWSRPWWTGLAAPWIA